MTPVLGPVEARLVLDLAGLPSLRVEHTLTRRVLAAIPTAHEHYRPCVGARSASELARHIVSAEIRFLNGATTGAFADRVSDLEAATDLPRLLHTQLAVNHTIHHRGQLSVYLREIGVTVPSTDSGRRTVSTHEEELTPPPLSLALIYPGRGPSG